MKSLFTTLLILLSSLNVNAQDTIRKKDGTEIIGIVKEISDVSIIYVRPDQTEGPLRKILVEDIQEIRYHDGTKEIFRVVVVKSTEETSTQHSEKKEWEPGEINTTNKPIVIKRRGPDLKIYPGERFPDGENMDKLFSNGFYLDGLMGFGDITKQEYYYDYYSGSQYLTKRYSAVTFGVRFGSKFYFGSKEKMRFGLNFTWAQLNVTVNSSLTTQADVFVAPLSMGPTCIFKFKENQGLEINPALGPVFSPIFRGSVGLKYGMDVKWRYQSLAVGIDFTRLDNAFNLTNENANLLSICLGVKF